MALYESIAGRFNLEGFDSWDQLLAYVKADNGVWYHAPLDRFPKRVAVLKIFKNGKIRIDPLSNDADNFTADVGHLNRFLRMVKE